MEVVKIEHRQLVEKMSGLSSETFLCHELHEFLLGWPLLKSSFVHLDIDGATAWAMNLPVQSSKSDAIIPQMIRETELPVTEDSVKSRPGWPLLLIPSRAYSQCSSDRLLQDDHQCMMFTTNMLNEATDHFSSDNLVGEGGCSYVYRGCLANGKKVAIKVLKRYKEAWADFSKELEIMKSLNHQNISPLLGACQENNRLMLVYEFSVGGNVEERLEDRCAKGGLSWEARYKIAIGVAEAIYHIHSGSSRSIIHRDVKSSNILLSEKLHPQLADFGLATWGPSKTVHEVVGTFGYIAPECLMCGAISEKTDVYAYGVVLLELLTGRKAITSDGHESLIKWALPLLAKGDQESILDQRLGREADRAETRRMFLIAILCTKNSPRLRPKFSQILKLLKKEQSMRSWVNEYVNEVIISEEVDDDCSEVSEPYQQNFIGLEDER